MTDQEKEVEQAQIERDKEEAARLKAEQQEKDKAFSQKPSAQDDPEESADKKKK